MLWSRKTSKPKVLLVEDNKLQADMTAAVIAESGLYDVLIAYNGIKAFDVLARHERGFNFLTNEIACILLDWQMPQMDGTSFLRELRTREAKSPFKRHTPVVIVSAYGDNELRLKAEDSSHGLASAYLTKPIEESQLLHVLKRIVFDKEAEIMRELLLEQRLKLQQERPRQARSE